MASKTTIFLGVACLSLVLIRVESRMGETFLERVQRAYTQANSEYFPAHNTKFTEYQIPEELQESVLPQSTRVHGWELKEGTNPLSKPQGDLDTQKSDIKDPITKDPQSSKECDMQDAVTKRLSANSNYHQHGTRQAAVHHTIPASQRNIGREGTVQSMDSKELDKAWIASYRRPDAATNGRVQSTFMHPDATREEYMPQQLSKEAMVRDTMPESIPEGTGQSYAKHTYPTFMPQSNHKSAQTEQRTMPTSMPQYTTRHTWAQGKRATIAAMLNGMGDGGDK